MTHQTLSTHFIPFSLWANCVVGFQRERVWWNYFSTSLYLSVMVLARNIFYFHNFNPFSSNPASSCKHNRLRVCSCSNFLIISPFCRKIFVFPPKKKNIFKIKQKCSFEGFQLTKGFYCYFREDFKLYSVFNLIKRSLSPPDTLWLSVSDNKSASVPA